MPVGSPLLADFSVCPPLLLLVATEPHWADFAAGAVVDAAGFSHHFPAVLCVLFVLESPSSSVTASDDHTTKLPV